MNKFKSYTQFNESFDMSSFFKSAHAAITEEDLIPIKDVIGKPRFPSQKEFDAAIEYLDIDPDFVFYNPNDIISPLMYWKGPVYEPFHGSFSMEALKMMRTKERLDQRIKMTEDLIKKKDYDRLFSMMDKKVLIPSFVKMYKEIPDDKKYDIFTDLYVRSEYGFQMFPIEIIKDCFSKRSTSKDHLERMKELKSEMKLNDDGTVTIYRGENTGSAKSDDAFSWTLTKKTAKFFADRFSKGAGKITEKKIDPKEIIDYLPHRGESEVILFPKKFGKIDESYEHLWDSEYYKKDENRRGNFLFRGDGMTVRVVLFTDGVKAVTRHPNMGQIEWFKLDKNSKFSTETTSDELWIFMKLIDIFSSLGNRSADEKAAYDKRKQELMLDPIFSKWFKNCEHKYRGVLAGKKYGL